MAANFGQDKVFLYMAGELITMLLNTSHRQVAEVITGCIMDLIGRFKITFASLLVDAESKQQPRRLDLLKQLWLDHLQLAASN